MNTSYRVVELVRAKISNQHVTASDTDISRALGVSRTAVSAYKHEKNVMSVETLAKAQELLQLPQQEYFDLVLTLTAEGASDPSLHDTWVRLHRLVRGALKGTKAASWVAVAAIVAAGTFHASPENVAFSATLLVAPDIDYTKLWIWRFRARRYRWLSPVRQFSRSVGVGS